MHHLIHQARQDGLVGQVVKVVSHVDVNLMIGVVDKWVIRGNHFADKLVSEILDQLPQQLDCA